MVTTDQLAQQDTWQVAGMKATGSHSVVADGLFVPDDQTCGFRMAPVRVRRPWGGTAMAEPWLSAEEFAAQLGVTKDTVYVWIVDKAMPAHKIGRLWKFQAS
jgi:excisionase family DNA binding protein